MARIQVDPEELETLGTRVDWLRQHLASSENAAITADVRAPRVHAALESFEGEWSDGLAILRNTLEECGKSVRAAAAEYRGADSCVEGAVTSDGGGGW